MLPPRECPLDASGLQPGSLERWGKVEGGTGRIRKPGVLDAGGAERVVEPAGGEAGTSWERAKPTAAGLPREWRSRWVYQAAPLV